MELVGEVLLREAREAEKIEMKGLIAPAQLQRLEGLLRDAYSIRLPKPTDYHSRSDLVHLFNTMAKEIFGNSNDFPAVSVFGSFLMDMFSGESDLDLSINFSKDADEFPRDKKKRVLRKFAKKLYSLQAKGNVFGVQLILNARVPIVKVTDGGSGIECDISVENRDGIERSQIVRMISSIDERFKKLAFLMKAWANAHKINNSRERTLNSLSIISLVAFHLQTRDPPILPPFSAILKDGTDPASVGKIVHNFSNYGKNNKESLADLFITLLGKLESVKTLWSKGLCVSTYEGLWIYKTWDSGVGCISVEDFTVRSENVARAVGAAQVQRIYQCISRSLTDLVAFNSGRMQGLQLMEGLFSKDSNSSQEGKSAKSAKNEVPGLPIPSDSIQRKKRQFTGGETRTSSDPSRLPVPPDSIQTKKRRFGEDSNLSQERKSAKKAKNKAPGMHVSSDSIQRKKGQFTGGETQTSSDPSRLPIPPDSIQTKKRRFGKDSNPCQEGKGAKKAKNKAPGLPIPSVSMQRKKRQSVGGETQTSSGTSCLPIPQDSIQTKKRQFMGGETQTNSDVSFVRWTPYHVRSPATGLGDPRTSNGPQHVPLVLVQNPLGLGGQLGQAVRPPLPLLNSVGFGGSYNLNPTGQLPHFMNYNQQSQPRLNHNPEWAHRNSSYVPGHGHEYPPDSSKCDYRLTMGPVRRSRGHSPGTTTQLSRARKR